MFLGYPRLVRQRLVPWALALHALWEFGQCTVLYGMWDWGFWRASVWMWGAIVGDVVITLGVAFGAAVLVGVRRLTPPDRVGWAALLGVGFVASVGLEWGAQALDLWDYSDLMPTVTVLGHTVGLSPIVQITLLPALAVLLATRRRYLVGI